jgi:divalent metal cation (Fe/Co/Zn/Cd) transporter
MIFSIVVTFILVKYLAKVAEQTKSLVIRADSLHYKSDLYTNA